MDEFYKIYTENDEETKKRRRKYFEKNLDPQKKDIEIKKSAEELEENKVKKVKENSKIEKDLDLHGKSKKEAEKLLEKFIYSCYCHKMSPICIITGKGKHSEGKPVLPGFVKDLLDKNKYVLKMENAPKKRGGSGAIIVRLKIK